MRIIVSDTSALIDLKKGDLLEAFCSLPYELIMPSVMLDSELLSFDNKDITLLQKHIRMADIEGRQMLRAKDILRECPALSTYDAIALVMAENYPKCILLTGDRRLRQCAEAESIECHGVLWVLAEIYSYNKSTQLRLINAVHKWQNDITVRLPNGELESVLKMLGV